MRNFWIVVVSFGLVATGCRSHPIADSAEADVPVVLADSGHKLVPGWAYEQFTADRRKIAGRADHRVNSIGSGVSDVRRVSRLPIVAATEENGWYFYATGVGRDGETYRIVQFISGYAIAQGDRQIISWSVW